MEAGTYRTGVFCEFMVWIKDISSVFWSALGQPYSKTQPTHFSVLPFCLITFFSSLKNHSKSLKKITPEKPLHNPMLNPNSHSHNTHFLTTFFNLKEYYENILTNIRYFYGIFIKAAWILHPLFKRLISGICKIF